MLLQLAVCRDRKQPHVICLAFSCASQSSFHMKSVYAHSFGMISTCMFYVFCMCIAPLLAESSRVITQRHGCTHTALTCSSHACPMCSACVFAPLDHGFLYAAAFGGMQTEDSPHVFCLPLSFAFLCLSELIPHVISVHTQLWRVLRMHVLCVLHASLHQ